MRFVLYGTYIPADELVAVAVRAEALGFDAITLPDHVVYPHAYDSPYPYSRSESGRAPWSEECEWPDPLIAATAIAAHTSRMRIVTGVFILAMRDPLLVAKMLATLDILSAGRVILGVGAGWLREEFEILGRDYDTRGPRTDEAISVLRTVWSGERVSHRGEHYAFPDISMRPAPSAPVPIYMGGDSKPALRRAARLGDGMLPPLNSYGRTRENLEFIESARSAAGRDRPFEYIAAASRCSEPEEIAALAELGVPSVHVDPFALYVQEFGGLTLAERFAALERYAEEVISPLAS